MISRLPFLEKVCIFLEPLDYHWLMQVLLMLIDPRLAFSRAVLEYRYKCAFL